VIWRRIWRDFLLLGSGDMGVAVAQLGFRSILIVALLPAEYGRLTLVLSVYNTLWLIANSGLPNSVARYLAVNGPAGDAEIVRSALRAAAGPTALAALAMAAVSGLILKSPLAALLGAIGVSSLMYCAITVGVLRGRHRVGASASIMFTAALCEVAPLALLWFSGSGVSALSAFGCFCLGNCVGLLVGVTLMLRTAPHPASVAHLAAGEAPTARRLLGFSVWLGSAAAGLAILPLVVRSAAALESFTEVAVIDVALVLFAIPQRLGAIVSVAVTPHASKAIHHERAHLTISRREHLIAIVPFVLAAAIVAFTPLIESMFDAIGRPEYDKSADYLALVLLAGPCRVLYGAVAGVLIGHGEGRFLATNVLSIAAVASGAIFAIAALGSMLVAFAVFVVALWVIYLVALARLTRIAAVPPPAKAPPAVVGVSAGPSG
jgi:O-antigen/teichoic acid export membrane protein